MTEDIEKFIEVMKTSTEAARKAAEVAAELAKTASLNAVESAKVSTNIDFIKADISDIKNKLDNKYVTMEAFAPVRNIVYGLMATLGLATLASIFRLIFIK